MTFLFWLLGDKSTKTEGQTQKGIGEVEVKKAIPSTIATKDDPADDFLTSSRPGSASTTNKRYYTFTQVKINKLI